MANYDLGTVGFTFQNTGAEETASDVSLVVQAIERAEKQFDSLQKALNRGKLSQEQYQRGVQQTEATIDRLTRVMQNQGSAIEQQAFAYGRAGRGLNEFGFYAQQVGYQVGDFFVQVQSGTNFLVAFGQQFTQLAGLIPGVFGAILGIGVSALTALGAGLMRSSESARTFQDALTSANDVLSETKDLAALARGDVAVLTEEFGRLTPATRALAEARVALGLRDMSDAAKALRDELTEMYNGNAWLNVSRAEELYAAFGFAGNASRQLEAALVDLKNQETLQGQADAATRLRELFISMAGPVQSMTKDELAFYLSIVDAEQATRNLLDRTGEVKDETSGWKRMLEGVKTVLDSIDGMALSVSLDLQSTASGWASEFLGKLTTGLENKAEYVKAVGGGRGLGMGGPELDPYGFRKQLDRVPAGKSGSSGSKRSGGGGGKGQTQEEYIQELIREDEQKRKLIGVSQEEQTASEREFKVREKLRDLKGSVTEAEIQATLRQMDATQKLIEQENRREAIISSASKTIEDAFMSMIDGSKSVADAFKGMIRDILLNVYRQNVVSPIGDMLSGAFKGAFQANGGAWNNGVQMFANGGVVGSPTMFGHSGGIGIMGEAGPEAIMPLKRGKNGKLGVQVDGNGGAVNIVQNFSFAANGDESVKRIIAQAAPQIAQMTQKQIIDSRRRGGSMKATFG